MNENLIRAVQKAILLTKYDDYENGYEIPGQIIIKELLNSNSEFGPCINLQNVKLSNYEHMAKKLKMLGEELSEYSKKQNV